MTPFFVNIDGSHSMTLIFSFNLSPKTSIFQFNSMAISYDSAYNSPFKSYKFNISNISCFYGTERFSPKDQKFHFHLKCPRNFGPKCSLSPNDLIGLLIQFFSHLMPLGAKTGAVHLYRFQFLYKCLLPPIDQQVSRIFPFSIDPVPYF